MISVSFNFSDVAQAAALFAKLAGTELASATVVGPAPAPAVAAPAPKPQKPAKAASPAPVAEPVAAPAPATAPPVEAPAPAAAPAAPEPAAAPGVDYPTLQKAVLALYAKDRGAAQAIATGMGFASYKVMPPEKWAEALELVNGALGA